MKASIKLLITGLLLATAVVSLALEGYAEQIRSEDTWSRVSLSLNPNRVLDAAVPKLASVKVGEGYKFKFYDRKRQAAQAIKLLNRATEAAAQRVLTLYRLHELDADDFRSILAANADTAPNTGFVTSSSRIEESGDFYGVPVKWNKQFADVLRAAVRIDEQHEDISASGVIRVVAADVILKATAKFALKRLETTAMNDIGLGVLNFDVDELVSGTAEILEQTEWSDQDVARLSFGDPSPLLENMPQNTIYIAFRNEIKGIKAKPVGRIITVDGAWGGRLGEDIVPWPNETSQTAKSD